MKKTTILYQTISEAIKKDILTGKYPVDSFIPTENELEAMFEVSKITIRKAIELLVSEGYLEKQRAIGTKVISNRLFNKLAKAQSFSTILTDEGLEVDKKILTIRSLKKQEIADLGVAFQGNVTEVKRLYYLDGAPFIYYTHYLADIYHGINESQLDQLSLYQLMKENGQTVARFEDEFDVKLLTSAEQEILQTATSHLLERRRFSYNEAEQIIEYSLGLYNTDLHAYRIHYEV